MLNNLPFQFHKIYFPSLLPKFQNLCQPLWSSKTCFLNLLSKLLSLFYSLCPHLYPHLYQGWR